MFSKIKFLVAFIFCLSSSISFAQLTGANRRMITTAVPFLTITPDSRAGGMGDVGVATSPDVNATHWNPAKLAFTENKFGLGVSYTPWLSKLVNDMYIMYVSGYYRINKRQALGASLRYFSLGSIQQTDIVGRVLQNFDPREAAFDVSYTLQLSKSFSIGGTARYIYSNLAGNINTQNSSLNANPANSAAVDLSAYYRKDKVMIGNINSTVAFGANISNIGPKITYNTPSNRDFIPTNLRLGTAWTGELDEYNKITVAFDINKLLVPSPPITDSTGKVIQGRDTKDLNMMGGILGSFTDAPNGMKEEWQEIMWSTGVEYWYNNLLAIRGGYFHEAANKGNRKYFSAGIGIRYQMFGLDFAYMIPQAQNHPLADTMRFSLIFNFNQKPSKAEDENTAPSE